MEVNACILTTHMVYLQPKQSLGYQQHSFRLLLLCICTTGIIQAFQAFHIYTDTNYNVHYTRRIPLAFISPCQFPFVSLLQPFLLTWNPPSCDRICPPRSQVACKLTSLVPPLTQTLPPPNSQNPNCPAPHDDDLRNNPASSVRNNSFLKRNYCFTCY